MADLTAMREGLAESLKRIEGLQNASGYQLAAPTPPACHVIPSMITYHEAMQDGDELYEFVVQVFVTVTLDIPAQKRLDKMLASSGPFSVKEALESNQEPGGGAYDVTVVRTSGQRFLDFPGRGMMLFADWMVNVRASPDT